MGLVAGRLPGAVDAPAGGRGGGMSLRGPARIALIFAGGIVGGMLVLAAAQEYVDRAEQRRLNTWQVVITWPDGAERIVEVDARDIEEGKGRIAAALSPMLSAGSPPRDGYRRLGTIQVRQSVSTNSEQNDLVAAGRRAAQAGGGRNVQVTLTMTTTLMAHHVLLAADGAAYLASDQELAEGPEQFTLRAAPGLDAAEAIAGFAAREIRFTSQLLEEAEEYVRRCRRP